MDRRRFVPSPEGLEDRKLMASLFGTSSNSYNGYYNIPNPTLTQPNTAQNKVDRVAHLPFYLKQAEPNRFLPESKVAQLQADLGSIIGKLKSPPSTALANFNHQVRDTLPNATLSPEKAEGLNRAFGAVLKAADAPPAARERLQADMVDLALIDSHDINPVFLATNDYSLVLQTALAIGRPIRTPTAPSLAPNNVIGGTGSHATNHRQPRLVGTYDADATIELVNANGAVLGTTTVAKGGRYAITPSIALGNGTYTVHVVAIESGFASDPSPTYTFRVVS